ncbi:hypothetical protein BGZ83_001001, partial [Gryganskiella cystojenkinii]
IAQAGSPLHHILSSIPADKGVQLRNLFGLLQSNTVTPSEFLARARTLLDPAQFEILDRIRRRQPAGETPSTPTTSQPPSGPGTPGVTTTPTTTTSGTITPSRSVATAASAPPHSVALPPVALPNRPTQQGPSLSLPNPQPGAIQASSTSLITPRPPPASGPATPSIALPPSSSTVGTPTAQSAPVRKRNTDTNAAGSTPSEGSKTSSKRAKTENQNLALGGANAGTSAFSLPSTPGPATPGVNGAPSTSSINKVSLPGQQKSAHSVAATSGAGSASGVTASGTAAGGSSATASKSSSTAVNAEKVNYDNITDVMGYVGVDLKEESDNIMRDNDGYSKTGSNADGTDRTRVQTFVNAKLLKTTVEKIATSHKLQSVDPDVVAYLAIATQERLRGLMEQMIHASKHRTRSLATAPPPMYDEEHAMYKIGVSQDAKKQLLAIERVEREEETKRKEQIAERERKLAAGEDPDDNGESSVGGIGAGNKKSKKVKETGPGVSAKNMSEEARKKAANQTALGFAGGSGRSYSWMMGGGGGGGGAGGAGGGAPSPLPTTPMAPSLSSGPANAGSPSASGGVSIGGGPMKPGLSRGSTMPTTSVSTAAGSAVNSPSITGSAIGGSAALASPSLTRSATTIGGSMILPPSTLGRLSTMRDGTRTVNVRDVLFCLERDRGGGGGAGSGQRVLIKTYAKRLR